MKRHLATVVMAAIMLSLVASSVLAQGVQNVELHGYMLNRFYGNQAYSARFVTERVSLSAVGQLGTDATGYVEVYFHPWMPDRTNLPSILPPGNTVSAEQYRTYLESAYVDLPFAKGRLRFGKGRQLNFGLTPSYPNRKTTQYGILSETFTQDRIVGAQYDCKSGTFDAGLTVFTDQEVETRSIGDFAGAVNGAGLVSTVKHFVDKDDTANTSGRLAVTARLGVTKPTYQYHFSGCVGRLQQFDANYIASQYGMATTTDKTHNKYGFDGSITRGPWVLQTEAYQGQFSIVQITGYSVLLGYQPKDKTRFCVRWAALNNDKTPVAANQPTWNVQQLTIGVVQPIRNGVWIEVDYEGNTESPPAGTVDKKNDMLIVEFFTGF